MSKSIGRRTLALLFALLIVTFALVSFPGNGEAQYAAGRYEDHYSDSSMTNLVGRRYTNCAGQVIDWGNIYTPYVQVWSVACGGGANPDKD